MDLALLCLVPFLANQPRLMDINVGGAAVLQDNIAADLQLIVLELVRHPGNSKVLRLGEFLILDQIIGMDCLLNIGVLVLKLAPEAAHGCSMSAFELSLGKLAWHLYHFSRRTLSNILATNPLLFNIVLFLHFAPSISDFEDLVAIQPCCLCCALTVLLGEGKM